MQFEIHAEHDAIDHLTRSVKDLADYLARATSADVSVHESAVEDTGQDIWIGRTAAASKFSERISGLDLDGYLLWGNGSQLVISGRTPYGTANGIYSFLQRYLGVRWFIPGPLFEFVPNLKEFRLPVVEEVSNPSFSWRMYSGVPGEQGADWSRRNLLQFRRPDLPFASFGHNLSNIFPPSEFAHDHPEIYCLIDGRRVTDQSDRRGQPCFSNPLTAQIATAKARSHFDSNPAATSFSLSVNDNMDFCQCDECTRFGVRTFRGRPIHSNAYFDFVNGVAKEVLRTHPDRHLTALAYWGVELPPEKIERLPDNVAIFLTQDTSQHHDPTYMRTDRAILAEWSRKCAHLIKYDYYGLGWLTARYFPTLAANDLAFLRQSGGIGLYSEAFPYWPNMAPQIYVVPQILWNANRDVRELLNEFFAFFSEARTEVAAFYEVLQKAWLRNRPGSWFEGFMNLPEEFRVVGLEDAERAWAHIARAHEASAGECRKRVQYLKDGFELPYLLIKGYHAGCRLRSSPTLAKEDMDAALSLISELRDLIARAETVHKEHILPDQNYHEIYFKDDRFQRKLLTWKGLIHSSCLAWLENAHANLQGNASLWEALVETLPQPFATAAQAIAKSRRLPNLLESPGAASQIPVPHGEALQIEWWLLRGKNGDCAVDGSFTHSGKSALKLESRGHNRLSTYIPAKPGGRYLIGAWGYADTIQRKRPPRIDVTFLEKPEDRPGRFLASDVLLQEGEWQRLLTLVEAPDQANLLGVHFVVDNQFERMWVDDVSVQEVS